MSDRDEDHEKSEGLRVIDKRRFDADGSTRAGATAGDTAAERPTAKITAKPESKTPPPQSAKTVPDHSSREPKHSARKSLPHGADFSSFVVGLATQALMMLGEMPNPETNRPMLNVEGARQTIDLLALLEEKTQGNLSAEEDQLLGEILASLRMAFVAKVKG